MRLIVAVELGNGQLQSKIQIWRENTNLAGVYYKPNSNSDIPLTSNNSVCLDTTQLHRRFQCTLTDSARVFVQPGDILGLELPPTDETALKIILNDDETKNYVFQGQLSSTVSLSEADDVTSDQPQISLLVALGMVFKDFI